MLADSRGPGDVEFVTLGPQRPVTIRAGKVVITVPPMPSLLAAFDPKAAELALFNHCWQGDYCTHGSDRAARSAHSTAMQNIGAATLSTRRRCPRSPCPGAASQGSSI